MWLRRNRALAQVFVGYKIMRRQTPGQNDPRTNSCSISEAKFYPTNSVNATGPLGHSLPRPQPPPSRAAGENSWRSVTRAITTPPVCERLHCKDEFKLCSYSSQPLFEFALATKTAWICSITIYKNKESINRKKPLSHMLAKSYYAKHSDATKSSWNKRGHRHYQVSLQLNTSFLMVELLCYTRVCAKTMSTWKQVVSMYSQYSNGVYK